jgi:hypothetical protein
MATVYLARDLKHDGDVAIKVLHPDLAESLQSRFRPHPPGQAIDLRRHRGNWPACCTP